jgi:prepilin-type N-terminal cleavage/methylation domain-containing protein
MTRSDGFTLIDLMIVVAIIAIIAAIAIPNLLSARLNANETSAIATLRSICTAQAQFQARAVADVDNDGVGEYGMFRELSGAANVRNDEDGLYYGPGTNELRPAVLSGAFRVMVNTHEAGKSGYHFKIFLVGPTGNGVNEHEATSIHGGPIHTNLTETTWCAYAWPANHGNSGSRTFFVNQGGDIISTDSSLYEGKDAVNEKAAGAAFSGAGAADSVTGRPAIGTVGRDGNLWRQVN